MEQASPANQDTNRTAHSGRGIAAMALCSFFWSLAGLFVRLIDWNAVAIAGARSLIAVVFIFIVVRKFKFSFSAVQIGAAVANAATMLLFVFAIKHTTAANAILLQYGAPVYVAIMSSFLLKEKPRAEHWAALVAILVGMGLFFKDGLGGGSFAGDLAGILSGLAFAAHIVLMRKQKDASPLESIVASHIITIFIAGLICIFLPPPSLRGVSLAAIAGLGVIQMGLPALLLSYSIKRISALQSILIAVIEPLFNPLWVFWATGEKPSVNAVAGGAVIVVAVVVSSIITLYRNRWSGAPV